MRVGGENPHKVLGLVERSEKDWDRMYRVFAQQEQRRLQSMGVVLDWGAPSHQRTCTQRKTKQTMEQWAQWIPAVVAAGMMGQWGSVNLAQFPQKVGRCSLVAVQNALLRSVSSVVSRSSKRQALLGIISAGMANALRYAGRKLESRFRAK